MLPDLHMAVVFFSMVVFRLEYKKYYRRHVSIAQMEHLHFIYGQISKSIPREITPYTIDPMYYFYYIFNNTTNSHTNCSTIRVIIFIYLCTYHHACGEST